MKLYPAILTESLDELHRQLSICSEHPEVDIVHLDVVDGFFDEHTTVTPLDAAEIDPQHLSFDLHLMTTEPQDFVFEAISVKAQLPVRAIIGQVEQMSHQVDFLREIKVQGWQAGLSLSLFTPIEEMDRASWQQLDIIQLMAIEAGSQGKRFNPQVFEKIQEVKALIDGLDHPVELIVDGGVKLDIITTLLAADVDSVAVGSGIWASPDPSQALSDLLQAVK